MATPGRAWGESRGQLDLRGKSVLQARREPLALLALKASRALLVLPAPRVSMATLAQLDLLARRGRKATRVSRVLLGLLALRENVALRGRPDLKALRGMRGRREISA